MTESKKLQTVYTGKAYVYPNLKSSERPSEVASPAELLNDARLAHEMREVIKQLVDALNNTRPDNARQSREAIDAAAPFLED